MKVYLNDEKESVDPWLLYDNLRGLKSLCASYTSEINQFRVMAFNVPQLTQASFLQKKQMLQNVFLIFLTLRQHNVAKN